MAIGNGGQMSNDVFTGVRGVQKIDRFRRSGDAKIMCRHLRQTQTKGIHHNRNEETLRRKNTVMRTSSGRMSIVVSSMLRPSVVVAGTILKTYLDLV
jgi:hypothetical protein